MLTGKVAEDLEKLEADAKRLAAEATQAAQDFSIALAQIPPERLRRLVFDLEVRMFGRGGMSQDERTHRELIAGVERGCRE